MTNDHKSAKLYSLIMAGGSGTRFWPESTQRRPKQYLQLLGQRTLLEETLLRLDGQVERANRYIVTTRDQEALAREFGQKEIGPRGLILEPCPRNTAPCILLSLAYLLQEGAAREDVVMILPSDHVILNTAGFHRTLELAVQLARDENKIITLGIPPHFPHTGYGYIQRGAAIAMGAPGAKEAYSVSQFKEKPDFETAKTYVRTGEYYWNAGMFVGPIGLLLQEMQKQAPEIFAHFHQVSDDLREGNPHRLYENYQKIPSISIDYAVMEKSSSILVVPAQFDWNDLGSWDALETVCQKRDGNVFVSHSQEALRFTQRANGNIVLGKKGQFIALMGVDDLIIVNNDKVLMVVPKKEAQGIKEIVEFLKRQGGDGAEYL